ncbi:MAG TPA: dihydroorotase family protein [Candidatus Micrarchaeaceae archaeon]|nr:dihydroorotase family protein [Candidatus Micrarchaeaceae archaeon]
MDIDVRIVGGIVHTPGGPVVADILVRGERIVGLVDVADSTPAKEKIDATGMHVIPGLIDLHAHTRVPGYEYKEDYLTASQAAAVGGVTTFVDMPNVEPPTDTVELFEAKRKIAADESIIDWGHFVSPTKPDQIEGLASAGATGFKIFQVSGGYPHDPRLAMGESDKIFAAFQKIAATGLHVSVHPFNQPLIELLTQQYIAEGKAYDLNTFYSLYTRDIIWRSAVAILLELQKDTGARLHLLHTHAAGSLELIRRAKAHGQRVTCAIDLKYYHLTGADALEQGPRAAPGGYIVEDQARMTEIWRSLNDGNLDIIDTDHAPHTLEDLESFRKDPWHGPWGSPQYEYLLSVTLDDVHHGKLPLETAIRLLSENSARLIGVFPQKGAIQVGANADLVLVDLDKEVVPSDEATYTKAHWTPYKGRRLRGAPVLTMLRGQVIAKDGKVIGKRGYGRYVEGVKQEPVQVRQTYSPGLDFRPVTPR